MLFSALVRLARFFALEMSASTKLEAVSEPEKRLRYFTVRYSNCSMAFERL